MIDIKEYVDNLDLEIGMSKRLNCPVCNGYKTFTVTNNIGTLLWNCYKASCSIKGNVRVRLSVDDIKNMHKEPTKEVEFELPEYIFPLHNRSDMRGHSYGYYEWLELIKCEDIMYDIKENRVVFTIEKDNKIVDAVGRANGKALPKWKRYGKSDTPYSHGVGDIAVVVEDCISAYVVGNNVYTGVALLGTSLLDGHREFLTKFSKVVVALDPDALPKTIQIAKELKGHIKEVKALKLYDDIKYMKQTDINNLKELIWN